MINAGYLMLDNRFGKSHLVWGVRVEQFDLKLTNKAYKSDSLIKQNNVDFLPSINYTYELNEKINLRASYYRTLARPEFRELSNGQFYDYEALAILQGNPNLKKSSIDNADVRFEYYPSAGQIISVSGFYKKFKNAIEANLDNSTSNNVFTFFNSPNVKVYGVETELRKSLDFIHDNKFLKNTIAYANVALIKSTVENGDFGFFIQEDKRQMVGQAPYVINAGLQHSFLNNKLSFNALYNRVGTKLYIAPGNTEIGGVWEAARNVFDMQLSLKVLKNKGEVKVNANDILNQNITLFYDMDKDKKYNSGVDQTFSRFKPGATYSLTFAYTF